MFFKTNKKLRSEILDYQRELKTLNQALDSLGEARGRVKTKEMELNYKLSYDEDIQSLKSNFPVGSRVLYLGRVFYVQRLGFCDTGLEVFLQIETKSKHDLEAPIVRVADNFSLIVPLNLPIENASEYEQSLKRALDTLKSAETYFAEAGFDYQGSNYEEECLENRQKCTDAIAFFESLYERLEN